MKAVRLPARVLSLLLLLACAARAQENRAGDCPAIDIPAPTYRLRVFVDPVTGKPREPTADELRELAEARLKSRAAQMPAVFEIVTHPDGMKTVDLGDAYLFDVRVEKLPDGSTKTECVPHSRPSSAGTRK